MKTSYFNPEVHSLTFRNFNHIVCGRGWGYQCGGMCCTVLSRFYKGTLIDCESHRKSFEEEIWNHQVGVIGVDPDKYPGWGKSLDAINKISENIDNGKPTLLYLRFEDKHDPLDVNLLNDHFVIAYALDDISDIIKRVYIYDPNYVYKRHYCNDPAKTYCIDPADNYVTIKNFDSYLEVNFKDKTITLNNGKVFRDSTGNPVLPVQGPFIVPVPVPAIDTTPVLGFKWYGQDASPGLHVRWYTDEKDVQHSCDITLIANNPPEILNSKPLISHTIRISKDGNVPADLKLWWEGYRDLYESGDSLFPEELKGEFDSPVKHTGLQCEKNPYGKTYKVYQNFAPSNPARIILQSDFLEKHLQLTFAKPAIESFTSFMEGTTPQRRHYYPDIVNDQIMKLQGLNQNNVEQVTRIPEGYKEALPVNHVSFSYDGDDLQSAINSGAYSLFEPVFYLGYIKRKVLVELTHNGLYKGATVTLTSNGSLIGEDTFSNNAVTFTLPEVDRKIYDFNDLKPLNFEITGGEISAGFSESFNTFLQYGCLIIHEPLIHKPHLKDFDVFARYFEKLLINIPHTQRIPQLENKFNLESAKHPEIERDKFKAIFCEQLTDRFVSKTKTMWNRKRLIRNFIDSFHSYNTFRKDRVDLIINHSKNLQELNQHFELLEDQMRPLIGRVLISKRPFRRVIRKVLKRKWK